MPHLLTHMKNIEGVEWKAGKHTKCNICNATTVWVCATCTKDWSNLVPFCPEVTVPKVGKYKSQKVEHACLAKHRCQPSLAPRGRAPTGGCKRARPGEPAAPPTPVRRRAA